MFVAIAVLLMSVASAHAEGCAFPSLLPETPLVRAEAFRKVLGDQILVLEGQLQLLPGGNQKVFFVRVHLLSSSS